MSKLTDLEICQRIAEIEGRVISGVGSLNVFVKCEPSLIGNEQYDPLTDDALCFRLMIKYKISLIQHQNNTAVYCIWNHDEKHATNTMTNPKRAICLAIIESKEPKT
jgi:hypothetical protein